MYEFLQGKVAEVGSGYLILDTGAVGYRVMASRQTLSPLQSEQKIHLLVHFHVTDSAQTLFGFSTPAERTLFQRLLQVNGIGPTSALGLLSAMPPDELARCILDENLKALMSIKGVGKKTAERLIIELREHLAELAAPCQASFSESDVAHDELAQVLTGLGFSAQMARKAAMNAREKLGSAADFQDLLRFALQSSTS